MTLTIQEIMDFLPHRYPFLLIDRVIEFEPKKRLVAIKNVTMNEPFFQGHFPGYPIMPGVLVVEAMAQAGALIMLAEIGERGKKLRCLRASRRPSSGGPSRPATRSGSRWKFCRSGRARGGSR